MEEDKKAPALSKDRAGASFLPGRSRGNGIFQDDFSRR